MSNKMMLITLIYLISISTHLSGKNIQTETNEVGSDEIVFDVNDPGSEDSNKDEIPEVSFVIDPLIIEDSEENESDEEDVVLSNEKPTWSIEECQQMFCLEMLRQHNVYRKLHGNVEPLKIDASLYKSSQQFAEELAKEGRLYHSKPANNQYGENVAFSTDGKNTTLTLNGCTSMGQRFTDLWYSEVANYNYTSGQRIGENNVIGHFSQIVWKATNKIGCGIGLANSSSFSNSRSVFGVAQYSPAGNFLGKFTINVLPPSKN